MRARRVLVRGRVQGVGYRDWLVARAREHGLDGWVRNRGDGSVEAVLSGPEPAVAEVLSAMRLGPPLARVEAVEERFDDPPGEQGSGFRRRPTVA